VVLQRRFESDSYGVYLYGFVIQQTLMATCPWAREWWLNILLSVPLATGIAALSWHFVEKPALELRRYLQPKPGKAPAATFGALRAAPPSAPGDEPHIEGGVNAESAS
jgi:peptidoglycan/LPS O-acetylase OafA/YrhL